MKSALRSWPLTLAVGFLFGFALMSVGLPPHDPMQVSDWLLRAEFGGAGVVAWTLVSRVFSEL